VTATTPVDVAALAGELHAARVDRRPVATLASRWPTLDQGDAYAVQARGIVLREADGEVVVGGKLGFTSEAMRRAMGVDHPNHGWLTDAMWVHGGVADLARYIHPKVEPEIAFLLAEELTAPTSAADVRRATAAVTACLEIVDSRYVGFRFGPLDNIADNSSAGGVVLGDPVAPDTVDLRLAGVVVSVDGVVRSTAAGAAAHGDPAAAVAWMVNTCGRPLPAGAVVISGGLTAPVDLRPGTVVTAEFDRIGPVTVRTT
jgi:2-oxo-3-hexenedioate decarboxylase